jgi:2-C-methyl-D-erythritol 4-phosphate cytidylyltransferase
MDAFAASSTVERAVVAVPAGRRDEIAALAPEGLELELIEGGATRAESVANALEAVDGEIAVVHDAARPLVTPQLIDRLVDVLVADAEVAGVIAATPVHDTVKRVVRGKQRIGRTERRDELWAAQTPQVFRTADLQAAHDADPATVAEATDDAMLIEQAGGIVLVEPAPAWNLKVTTPDDLRLVELLLSSRS